MYSPQSTEITRFLLTLFSAAFPPPTSGANGRIIVVQCRTVVSARFAGYSMMVGMEDSTDHNIAQEIGRILALAILRQRQKSSNNSVDFSDTGSVYAEKESAHE